MNDKIFYYGIKNITNTGKMIDLVESILSDNKYLEGLSDRKNNWMEVENELLRKTIIDYLNSIVVVEV